MKRLHPKHVARKLKSHHDFMWDYFLALVKSLFRPAMFFLVIFGWSLILVFAALFYFVEKDTNTNLHSYFDAIYFAVSTMTTVGFGDISPSTTLGRIVSMVMMMIGTGLFVSYTALISSTIINLEQLAEAERKESD